MNILKHIRLLVFILLPACLMGAEKTAPKNFEFPKPTGTYAVGTKALYLIDKTRRCHIQKELGHFRELMVQLWYPSSPRGYDVTSPTDAGTDNAVSPYFPQYLVDSIKKDFCAIPGVTESDLAEIALIKAHAIANAPISKAQTKYPLIILSHGHGCSRLSYTAIAEELASHGYVVAAPDHTYDCSMTQFPDGRIVTFQPTYDIAATDKPILLINAQVDRWVADIRFVIKSLVASECYIDSTKIAAMGHSFGGAAAIQAALQDAQIKAVALMDPAMCGTLLPNNQSVPFIYFLASETQWEKNIEDFKVSDAKKLELRNMLKAYKTYSAYNIVFKANHMIFSDSALLKHINLIKKLPEQERDLGTGPLDGFAANEATRAYLLAFFNKYIKGSDPVILKKKDSRFEKFIEFECTTHKK